MYIILGKWAVSNPKIIWLYNSGFTLTLFLFTTIKGAKRYMKLKCFFLFKRIPGWGKWTVLESNFSAFLKLRIHSKDFSKFCTLEGVKKHKYVKNGKRIVCSCPRNRDFWMFFANWFNGFIVLFINSKNISNFILVILN